MMMSPSLSLLLILVAAFQLAEAAKGQKNRIATVPPKGVEEEVQAKDRDINLGRASVGVGQVRVPLPSPSEGWLVIMQRFDLSVNFRRNWTEYKNGFGELGLQKEFWLGNEAIHLLTTGTPHKLRVELLTKESLFYADYDSFSLDSEDKKYTLHVSGYSGNAGDSLTAKGGAPADQYHDGLGFSTPDVENDPSTKYHCGAQLGTGWWFNGCYDACLTCYDASFIWNRLSGLKLSTGSLLIGARMRVMRK